MGSQSRGIRATLINSTLDPAELRARLLEIEAGHYDLVYVAPERFRSNRFVEVLGRVRPAILAVDEAHCISEWGHDFRPDYARIGQARRRLGSPPCIALTATATDMVRRDIAEGLDLRDPAMFVTGFDRPNLHYAVVEARRDNDKLSALAEALERMPGAGDRLRLEPGSLRVDRAVSRPCSGTARPSSITRASRARNAPWRKSGSWRARSRPSWRPTPSAWGSTRPTSDRSSTST